MTGPDGLSLREGRPVSSAPIWLTISYRGFEAALRMNSIRELNLMRFVKRMLAWIWSALPLLFGVGLTIGYLYFISKVRFRCIDAWSNECWDKWQAAIDSMAEHNQFGDFLAGFVGPIALIWIVLAFIQQGRELRLQVRELNQSVEQQRQLVEATRSQIEHDKELAAKEEQQRREELEPIFQVDGGASSPGTHDKRSYTFHVTNLGALVRRVRLEYDPPIEGASKPSWHSFEEGESKEISILIDNQLVNKGAPFEDRKITIDYLTLDKRSGVQNFELYKTESGAFLVREM